MVRPTHQPARAGGGGCLLAVGCVACVVAFAECTLLRFPCQPSCLARCPCEGIPALSGCSPNPTHVLTAPCRSKTWSTGAASCAACTAARSSCAKLWRGTSATSRACGPCWTSARVRATVNAPGVACCLAAAPCSHLLPAPAGCPPVSFLALEAGQFQPCRADAVFGLQTSMFRHSFVPRRCA